MRWLKLKVKEYYQDDPRAASIECRKIDALMCPHCKKKFYPITELIKNANYCPACGEAIKK